MQGQGLVRVAAPVGRAAVLGRPIGHSLSPVLHRAAYAGLGLRWTYEAIDCDVDLLPSVLGARADWAGFSCTMPLKRAVLEAAATVSDRAATVGAGNTLVRAPGGWFADNTDVAGIVAALGERSVTLSADGDICVLGAGGTAQAVVVALASLGVRSCRVLVRDTARTGELSTTAARAGVEVDIAELRTESVPAELVVSTLPGGAADQFASASWQPGQVLLDVVYASWPTPLAAAAAAAGATIVSGALMLLHQAAEQVRLMTGLQAPVEAMRIALASAAPGCGA